MRGTQARRLRRLVRAQAAFFQSNGVAERRHYQRLKRWWTAMSARTRIVAGTMVDAATRERRQTYADLCEKTTSEA